MSRSNNKTIDYSKWDKMDFSDCDDDDEGQSSDQFSSSSRPIVTRLDNPTSVTFGGNAPTAVSPAPATTTATAIAAKTKEKKDYGVDYSKWDNMDYGDDDDDEDDDDGSGDEDRGHDTAPPPTEQPDRPDKHDRTNDAPHPPQPDSAPPQTNADNTPPTPPHETVPPPPPTKPTADGAFDARKLRLLTQNGGTFRADNASSDDVDAYWCQDRYEVVLSVGFDPRLVSTRDVRVRVRGALEYKDRCAATGSGGGGSGGTGDRGTLTVSSGVDSSVVLMEGQLSNFVYLPEGEQEVEWEIDIATNPDRGLIRVTLSKAVPMQGLTIWWSRPLEHFTEIDTQMDVKGRYGADGGRAGGDKDRSEKVKEAWDDAHRMFQEKVKNREKQVIHV